MLSWVAGKTDTAYQAHGHLYIIISWIVKLAAACDWIDMRFSRGLGVSHFLKTYPEMQGAGSHNWERRSTVDLAGFRA